MIFLECIIYMKIACIFDWDGTIVDSGRTHEHTWIELAKSHNLKFIPNFFEITFGVRNIEIITENSMGFLCVMIFCVKYELY